MAGGRGALPKIYTVKFHVPCVLGAEATALPLDSSWTEARLVSVACIEIEGHTTTEAAAAAGAVEVSCSDLEPLHSITVVNGSGQDAAVIRTLAVRPDCRPRSRIARRTSTATTPSLSVTAQLWVELEVKVRPNAHIFDTPNPTLCSSWRLLLPWLVACSREEAPAMPTSRVPALTQGAASREATTLQSPREARRGLEVRALEAVYASLKPATVEPLGEMSDGGVASSVGSGPGAFGLNAVPAAVVMKVAQYLPASSLDALSGACKAQYRTCNSLVPGLKLDLFPHQKKGLQWMRDRERDRGPRYHPEFVPIDPTVLSTALSTQTRSNGSVSLRPGSQAQSNGAISSPCPSNRSQSNGSNPCTSSPAQSNGKNIHPRASSNGGVGLLSAPGTTGTCLAESPGLTPPIGRVWVNVVDGMVSPDAPAPCVPVRGGMLCDEPGLGKTITVLALLLRTRGLLPEAVPVPEAPASSGARSGSGTATAEQWRHWGKLERQVAMMKVVRALQVKDAAGVFCRELDQDTLEELGMPDYIAAVGEPIDLQTIARRASSGPRDSSLSYDAFEDFAADVRRVFSNAVAYHGGVSASAVTDSGVAGGVHQVSVRAKAIPRVAEEARKLGREAEELLKGVFVGRRVDRGQAKAKRLRALKPSSATLIVVPPPMLPHWRNQITLHAEPGRLGPFFFDERSDLPLPPVENLEAFGVVVTTYQRLTNEQPRWQESPLSRIYWLRMVLDEGHAMGTSALTSNGDVARRVEAERRWVMTGTPTPTTSADAALRNLSNLLSFLREREYSPDWRRNVRGPFMANRPEGRERLRRLLSEVMIRHTKSELLTIPPPKRESALLDMSQQETLAYDTIVSFVRSNLMLTSMEGKTSGWQDSLLNPANTKYAMEALTNIRLSCCGGGSLIPVVKRHHHIETLEMLRELHAVGAVDVRRIDNFIYRATAGEISSCQGCGEPLQLLHVTPCAHLVCVDCVDCVNNACRVCGKPYDVDDFQRIQPGFELKWMYNVREQERLYHQRRAAARLARKGPGQAVPKQQSDSSGGQDVVVVPRTFPRVEGGGGGAGGGGSSSSGIIGGGDAPSSSPAGAGAPLSPGGGSSARGEEQGGGEEEEEEEEGLEMHSKAFFTMGQLKAIVEKAAVDRQRGGYRPLKAIVFSQFLPVLNIVGDKFLREFGGHPEKGWQERGEKHVAEFWGKNRAKELERFRTDPACLVLLLGKKGAHGLDLSFVTHMFLMDQIWDRSLETQVVARANRMGATGSVTVVQLIMKDTMEQELRSYVNSNDRTRPDGSGAAPPTPTQSPNNSAFGGTNKTRMRGDESPASVAAAAVTNGTPPSPSRKTPQEKSPRGKGGRKRPRPRVGGRRSSAASSSSSSSHQEHAKVHFLLTSLRSSKSVIDGGSGGGADKDKKGGEEEEDGEEEEEEEEEEGGKGAASRAGWKGKGKKKAVEKRGVTFSGGGGSSNRRPAFAAREQPSARSAVDAIDVNEMADRAISEVDSDAISEIGASATSKISAKPSEAADIAGRDVAGIASSEVSGIVRSNGSGNGGRGASSVLVPREDHLSGEAVPTAGIANTGSVNRERPPHALFLPINRDHFSGGGTSPSNRDRSRYVGVGGGVHGEGDGAGVKKRRVAFAEEFDGPPTLGRGDD